MTKKINVMISTDPAGQGGIASVVQSFLQQSFAKQWKIVSICSHRPGSKLSLLWIFLLACFKLIMLRLKYKPGIAHLHMASRGSFSRKYLLGCCANLMGFKVILHLHGGLFDKFYLNECNAQKKAKVTQLFGIATQVVVLSKFWQQWVQSTFPQVRKVQVIYNAGPAEVPLRAVEQKFQLVFLGRLVDEKGIPELISALPAVLKQVPNLSVILGGDGDIAKYRQQAAELGVVGQVEFAGWLGTEQKFKILAAGSVFVLPSYHEGFPVGIVEAMACQIPIVATGVGGIPDAITHGVEGLLVPVADPGALADAIIQLLTDPVRARQLADNAYQKFRQQFSPEAVMPQWQQLYAEILND